MHQFIPKSSEGRRFAISDIHGCSQTFHKLIWEKVKLEKKDQLFLLGDYINRGPDGRGVLDAILELQKEEYQIFALRGNHEKLFLLVYQCGLEFFEDYLNQYNSSDLLHENLYDYLEFCDNLGYYYLTEKMFLSHCGISQSNTSPLTDIREMFSEIDFDVDEKLLTQCYIIHGHRTTSISKIKDNIQKRNRFLNIDAGCVYKDNPELGFLVTLNLDTFELIWQENID